MTAKEALHTRLAKLRWRSGGETTLTLPPSALLTGADALSHLLLGAVLAGAVVFREWAPFAVAFVGASGPGLCGGCALLGACFGYLILLPFSQALRYASSAILTFAFLFAFADWKALRRPWAGAAAAGVMNAVTGFVTLSGRGWQGTDLLCFAAEVALTLAAARCYRWVLLPVRTGRLCDPRCAPFRVGLAFLCCTLLMSLAPVTLGELLSLGRALGMWGVLTAAWLGGCACGAMCGVLAGLCLDLAGEGVPLFAMVYALSALCAGAFRGRGRLWAAGAWLGGCAAAALWTCPLGLPAAVLWEALLGALLFLAVPRERLARLGGWLLPAESGARPDLLGQELVRRQLEGAAAAFREVYRTVSSAFRVPENDGDAVLIFRRASAQVCRSCPRREACWQRDYVSTLSALNDALPPILARGRGEGSDFPAHFSHKCLHFTAFLAAVNRELAALLYRRQYNSRIHESRQAVARQYAQLSDLLGSAAVQLGRELIPDPRALDRVRRRLHARGLEARADAFRDGRGLLRIRLSGADALVLEDPRELRALSALLGVPLRGEREGDALILLQQEPLMAVAGVAARKKDGETVSGDVGTYFKGPEGTLYVLLCDGMGSGPAAHRESSLAARLLEQFLLAGVDTGHALVTLCSALALRGEEAGGFTTVDLLEVDLFTGGGAVYKLGAAPSYLRRGEEVRRLSGTALPAGLSEGTPPRPDRLPVQLAPGDCVVLVSDGVTGTGDDGWLRRRLAAFRGHSPRELARALIQEAPEGAADDCTAMVVRIEKRT